MKRKQETRKPGSENSRCCNLSKEMACVALSPTPSVEKQISEKEVSWSWIKENLSLRGGGQADAGPEIITIENRSRKMESEILLDTESGIKNTGVLDNDQFATTQYTLEPVNVDQVQQINAINNYLDKSDFLCPIIVRDPSGDYLIDGQHYFDEARLTDSDEVTCFVYHVESHDATELALRKYAIRLKAQGGSPTYPEIIRNTRQVIRLLEADGVELKSYYSHGGSRKGETFSGDVDDDIRIVLMNRTGKSRTSINDYINYGDLVNDAVMDKLVAGITTTNGTGDSKTKPASKEFFKSIQPQKREWILAHKTSMSAEEIEKAASEKVWAAFLQDHTGKKVTIFKDDTPQGAVSSKKKIQIEPDVKGENVKSNNTAQGDITVQASNNDQDSTNPEVEHPEQGGDGEYIPADSAEPSTESLVRIEPVQDDNSPMYMKRLNELVVKLDNVALESADPVKLLSDLEQIISGLMTVLTEVRSVVENNERLAA